jgi:hypothetical protein
MLDPETTQPERKNDNAILDTPQRTRGRRRQDPRQVGPADVLVTLLAGLAAWAVHLLLARRPRTARWWPFVGSTAVSFTPPTNR